MNAPRPRTIRSVPPPDLSKTEVKEEGNLLIEAVSLLVQRQRETETWVAEQVWQAEERAAAAEQRYSELEARLVGIEEHLSRLVQDVEPRRGDAVVEERLARLREQVEGLKSAGDGLPSPRPVAAAAPVVGGPAPAPMAPEMPPATVAEPRYASAGVAPAVAPSGAGPGVAAAAAPTGAGTAAVTVAPTATAPAPGFLELLGATTQDRVGVLLIGAGGVAVLYVILTQLRF